MLQQLRPAGLHRPAERLVALFLRAIQQFRDHTPGFASLAAFESSDHEMAVRRAGSDHPAQPYYGEFVSGNSFDTLGIRAYAGRLLRIGR